MHGSLEVDKGSRPRDLTYTLVTSSPPSVYFSHRDKVLVGDGHMESMGGALALFFFHRDKVLVGDGIWNP